MFLVSVECLRVEPFIAILQSFFTASYTCMSTGESRIPGRLIAWLEPKT